MFQEDRPVLLDELTGGLAVTEFLNVELPKVLERRLDLVMRLADGSILHVELQAKNGRQIAYREGVYCFLLARMYPGCRIRQVVLYVGSERLRMPAGIDLGETKGAFRLLDIREIDAGRLLASSNPADCALAILAGSAGPRIIYSYGSFDSAVLADLGTAVNQSWLGAIRSVTRAPDNFLPPPSITYPKSPCRSA